ncbi:hypothetical protein P4U99_26695 [Brevibacillus agri]|uniref:hypothetical protein n=1 Tax=Brevibacillus agri TaxID=51101 RepID=UPI001EE508BF|nr:hypothetical protein [Brevibacillus agri]MCG5252448.1 hypothetical protein [Brevibacillus agri]MED1646703.1 hypothetical protein [Brevibacillus agri]MED1657696.1 hypothetical protein [Brevibacillus agri]MED1689497.1 hypothetical protein [Brevibacillus agri]MED1694452.1 hypothetical protein [Brevibacillus agri]
MSSNSVIQAFGNDFLSAFGIQLKRIVEHVPMEIINLRKERVWIEELFRLEDDSLLYFVPHASPNPRDLDELRFQLMEYHLKIYEMYEKLITTIVLFGPAISNAKTSIDLGAIKYRISDAIWTSRIDGDEFTEELARKVRHNGDLTDEELSLLTMLPFMNTKGSNFQRALEAVQIANTLVAIKRDLVIKLMKAMAEKLLTGDDFEQVVHAFEMA